MGERLLCKQEVIGSIPFTSTTADRMTRSVIRVVPRQAQRLLRRKRLGAERGSRERRAKGLGKASLAGAVKPV